ncbi:MAG: hypothetical protein O7D91_04350 [Planctomycetota bacterium]|nr:hypothetical protein [Planctomycetota bacterium]
MPDRKNETKIARAAGSSRLRRRRRRRGVVLMLVLITVAIAVIVSFSFMGAQTTSIGIAQNVDRHTRARAIAESGLAMVISEIDSNVDWRTDHSNGVWASDQSLAGGLFTVSVEDGIDVDGDGVVDGDGDLSNNTDDPVTASAIATYQGVSHTIRAVVHRVNRVLMVVPDAASLTAQQDARHILLESWRFTVSLISHTASQADFDTALASTDAVYVVNDVTHTALGTKLTSATVGLVTEMNNVDETTDELGLANLPVSLFTNTAVEIMEDTHYITDPYPLGVLAICGSSQPLSRVGAAGNGAVILATRPSNPAVALVAYEVGAELYNSGFVPPGTPAPARRVLLPWGGSAFDFNSLTADGQTILKRALAWVADGGSVGYFGSNTTPDGSYASLNGVIRTQIAFRVTLAESGTLTSISVYLNGVPPKEVRYGLYTDSGGEPDQLIVESAARETDVNAFKWVTINMPATTLAAGDYWIAFGLDHSNMAFMKKDGSGSTRYKDYDAIPDGYLSAWGASDFSVAWQIGAFANFVPDSALEATQVTYAVGWQEEP